MSILLSTGNAGSCVSMTSAVLPKRLRMAAGKSISYVHEIMLQFGASC